MSDQELAADQIEGPRQPGVVGRQRPRGSEGSMDPSTDFVSDSRGLNLAQEHEVGSGLYVISVAARILDMHPQTLRKYERLGMVTPSRTVGMLRLYSELDIAQLRLIKHLVSDLGLNLAGVRMAQCIFNRLIEMRSQIQGLESSQIKALLNESLSGMMKVLEQGST